MSSAIGETIWKDAPRLCKNLSMPAYRYLPGKNVHPDDSHLPPFSDAEALHYGIDLYHAGYFYEAHEAWESLWLHLPSSDLKRTFLHGLIQLTAALLKQELEQLLPAQRLSRRAHHYLEIVLHHDPKFQGVDLEALTMSIQKFFQPLWAASGECPPMAISKAPRLQVINK